LHKLKGVKIPLKKQNTRTKKEDFMKKMKGKLGILPVIEWIMLKNGWEYYVSEITEQGLAFCLVDGFEQEAGDVDLNEIKPYITCRTKDLKTIQPAIGYKWIN
jgi:hypothetical protein